MGWKNHAVTSSKPRSRAAFVAAKAGRNHGLDVLRGCTALLVVAHHTALTYGGSGSWYFREFPVSDAWSSRLLTLFCAFNQAWFMGLFFLLAGYFTPGAIDRYSAAGFLRERLVRLGLPLLVFGFVLGPIAIALAQTVRGHPFVETLLTLFSHATFNLGPPWFCWALILFSVLIVLWRAILGMRYARAFPSNRALLWAALGVGSAAFLLRLVWPVGVNVFGLQLGYFASYVLLYAAGCLASRERLLSRIPDAQARLWIKGAAVAFPVLPAASLLAGHVAGLRGSFDGGRSAPAVIYAVWEPFVAWGVILHLLRFFQRRFAEPGKIATALGRRAFAIFIIHPPIVVGVTVALHALAWPALIKFLLASAAAGLICYVVAGLVLRLPYASRVL